jgi:hypothetical protein
MAYDTAAEIIAAAATECGLNSVADPFSSSLDEQVQMRNILNQCGRELYTMFQWQQFVKSHTINTGATPGITHPDGRYPLPTDFGYFISQTGWTPTSVGMGLPLGGPLTPQQYTALVATNLASSTIYVSFLLQEGEMQVLPTPAPANTDITFQYVTNCWAENVGGTGLTKCTASDDVVKFEPILMSVMLAMRYRQAKGIDASALTQRFQNLYAQFTGVNGPAPVLSLTHSRGFPYLNPWTNIPQSGFGL